MRLSFCYFKGVTTFIHNYKIVEDKAPVTKTMTREQ